MAEESDTYPQYCWQQGTLMPPNQIRLDLVVHLDGVSGSAQYSVERSEGIDQLRTALVVRHGYPLEKVGPLAVAEFLAALRVAVSALSPF